MTDACLHKGWLTKKGKLHKNWLRRYFLLRTTTMEYFTDETLSKHIPIAGNALCYTPLTIEVDKPLVIGVKTQQRIYYLQAESAEEWLLWNEVIFNAIADLFIASRHPPGTPLSPVSDDASSCNLTSGINSPLAPQSSASPSSSACIRTPSTCTTASFPTRVPEVLSRASSSNATPIPVSDYSSRPLRVSSDGVISLTCSSTPASVPPNKVKKPLPALPAQPPSLPQLAPLLKSQPKPSPGLTRSSSEMFNPTHSRKASSLYYPTPLVQTEVYNYFKRTGECRNQVNNGNTDVPYYDIILTVRDANSIYKFLVYRVDITWRSYNWTIFRRYKQFVKLRDNMTDVVRGDAFPSNSLDKTEKSEEMIAALNNYVSGCSKLFKSVSYDGYWVLFSLNNSF